MALRVNASGDFDIKSPADEYINFFISETLPNFFDTQPMEVRIQLESTDVEKKTLTMTIYGNWVSKYYKTVKATFTVTPKERNNGSRVAWTIEYDKIRHDIGDAENIFQYLIGYLMKLDDKIHLGCVLNGKADFINVESQADTCYKAFIEGFKDDANVVFEDLDHLENKRCTMRMIKYKTLKVTTTITPMENTDVGSHVAWIIESDNDIIDPDLSPDTVRYLREMVRDKFIDLHIGFYV